MLMDGGKGSVMAGNPPPPCKWGMVEWLAGGHSETTLRFLREQVPMVGEADSSWCHVIFPFVRTRQSLSFLRLFLFCPVPNSGSSLGEICVHNGGIISSQSWPALTLT